MINDIEINHEPELLNIRELSEIEKSLEFKTFRDFKDTSEKIFILKKLESNKYNVAKTAKEIELQRSHVYNKIDLFNIELPKKGTLDRPKRSQRPENQNS